MKEVYTDKNEIIEMAVKYKQKWAVYVSNQLQYDASDEHIWQMIVKRCATHKEITQEDIISIMQGGLFFFDTQEEMETFFNIFDKAPVYSSALFAMSYDNQGNSLSENT